MSENQAEQEAADLKSQLAGDNASPPKRSNARRLGCAIALLIWFALLLTPCALFYLAANGEIRFDHRDVPQPHAHPLLLVSLVSEAADRGLRFETSRIIEAQSNGEMLCVETAVRFLLWEYSGGNQDVSYCDCYQREGLEADWELVGTSSGVC
ncbi:MAG: hypothetical protein OXI30_09835 [Chloroflexota bacterium]|nr:hypothetical protein [Chloroflexota bacterium]